MFPSPSQPSIHLPNSNRKIETTPQNPHEKTRFCLSFDLLFKGSSILLSYTSYVNNYFNHFTLTSQTPQTQQLLFIWSFFVMSLKSRRLNVLTLKEVLKYFKRKKLSTEKNYDRLRQKEIQRKKELFINLLNFNYTEILITTFVIILRKKKYRHAKNPPKSSKSTHVFHIVRRKRNYF